MIIPIPFPVSWTHWFYGSDPTWTHSIHFLSPQSHPVDPISIFDYFIISFLSPLNTLSPFSLSLDLFSIPPPSFHNHQSRNTPEEEYGIKWSQEKKSLQIPHRKIERTSHNLSKQDANDQSRNKGNFFLLCAWFPSHSTLFFSSARCKYEKRKKKESEKKEGGRREVRDQNRETTFVEEEH